MEFLKLTALTFVLLVASIAAQPRGVALGLPDRTNEHASLASDGQFVALTWAASKAGGGTDLYVVTSRDGGQSFTEPVRVNHVEGQVNVNGEQPPQIAIVPGAAGRRSLVVVWTSKNSGGTRLVTATSSDDGRTFGRMATVQGTDAPGNRGWESIAVGPSGKLFALWLDHRDMAAPRKAGEAHQHGPQASQVFFAPLDGATPHGLTRGVCYCCRTSLSVAADGSIYAAWRHVYPGNRRDIAFTVSRDGGRTFTAPVRVSEDNWEIDGCPENGPAVAIDSQRRVHVVWPTRVVDGGGETLALFHAMTADGKTFTPRARIATSGVAYHPRVSVAPDGSLVAAWDEVTGGVRRIRLSRAVPDRAGRIAFRPLTVGAAVEGRYPTLTTTSTHAILAWTSREGDATRIAVARVPLS